MVVLCVHKRDNPARNTPEIILTTTEIVAPQRQHRDEPAIAMPHPRIVPHILPIPIALVKVAQEKERIRPPGTVGRIIQYRQRVPLHDLFDPMIVVGRVSQYVIVRHPG